VTVVPDAIIAWRACQAPDTAVLASWPGGAYRGADLRRYIITLDQDGRARLDNATDDAFIGVVRGIARNAYLAMRAKEMGISISQDEAAAGARRWTGRAERWASVLGFRPGASAAEVKDAARAALAAMQQEIRIARSEVASISEALRAVYTVERADPPVLAGSN